MRSVKLVLGNELSVLAIESFRDGCTRSIPRVCLGLPAKRDDAHCIRPCSLQDDRSPLRRAIWNALIFRIGSISFHL